MMSAKGHVMYYSNASNTGKVPTADCISMNSKKGEVGGSREDISVARPESKKKKKRIKGTGCEQGKRTDLKSCFNTKDMHHSIKIHTLHSASNYDALSGGAPLSAPIQRYRVWELFTLAFFPQHHQASMQRHLHALCVIP